MKIQDFIDNLADINEQTVGNNFSHPNWYYKQSASTQDFALIFSVLV